MFIVSAICKRADSQVSGVHTAVSLLKTHKHQLKHVRLGILLLLMLGLLLTVPTELLVEVRAISSNLVATSSAPPTAGLITIQQIDELSPQHLFIRDVVFLPEDVLLLVRMPGKEFRFPGNRTLVCVFNGNTSSEVRKVEYVKGLKAMIRCGLPDNSETLQGKLRVKDVAVLDKQSGRAAAKGRKGMANGWRLLVVELWATEKDVVLIAKGINKRRGRNVNTSELRCVFGRYETEVRVSSQEVFRCDHPPAKAEGAAATIRWGRRLLPTVVYYERASSTGLVWNNHINSKVALAMRRATSHASSISTTPDGLLLWNNHIKSPMKSPTSKSLAALEIFGDIGLLRAEVCLCTMVNNVARFLPEWVMWHAHLGVERFLLYDNNSDDNLDEVIQVLNERQLDVQKYTWPWSKMQEAGFSHCAATAHSACKWMMFADVDEFLFPSTWLATSASNVSVLRRIVEGLNEEGVSQRSGPRASWCKPLGQISFNCRNFGPSGRADHPQEGVTQGYTCRLRHEERHKSIVKLEAITDQLLNVVHHFELRPGYRTIRLDSKRAVINHYKFQAWPEFRRKFQRRVSAYVVDWRESRNPYSRDRTPGLGYEEEKPNDWENQFCEVRDTALRDYTHHVFADNITHNNATLAWQHF